MKKENKVFLEIKFIDGFKNDDNKTHFTDLISIGLVKQTGETYFAYSSEYQFEDADEKIVEEVIKPLFKKMDLGVTNFVNYNNFHKFSGKKKKVIAKEIKEFVGKSPVFYALYDVGQEEVLLTSLYGKKEDLPEDWPEYTKNIQQIIDGFSLNKDDVLKELPPPITKDVLDEANWIKDFYLLIKKKVDKK